ncbi:hypothetical protein DPMN_177407 [Dreissena polymorpha]|uniref:Uncharacterized protein n=1 Tax=Dreissena polymorpha TaxID=45954 RepID=A0A9D4EA67_DREPO|nr:hypothetical protein DPMN_177407 [Dreissena polymorpha]
MLAWSYLFTKETTNYTCWPGATCPPKRPRIAQTSLELPVYQRDHELYRLVWSYMSAKETTNCTD